MATGASRENLRSSDKLHIGFLSTNTPPAINLDVRPSHELALIAPQKTAQIRHILRIRQPAQRYIEEELLHVLLGIRHPNEGLEQARA
jgi:hypothetical protein